MEVASLEDRHLTLSIRRLAEEFGMARETITKRLTLGNVKPAGSRSGHAVYRLRDVVPALFTMPAGDDGELDPRKLPPQERNAWYQSESRRLGVETEARQLIPAAEVEAECAEMIKSLVQFLEVLPDILERDAELRPEQIDRMHEAIETQRQTLYVRLTQDADVRTSA